MGMMNTYYTSLLGIFVSFVLIRRTSTGTNSCGDFPFRFHESGSDRLKYGKGWDIWPAPSTPNVYEGNADGILVNIDAMQELAEEDAALANSKTNP